MLATASRARIASRLNPAQLDAVLGERAGWGGLRSLAVGASDGSAAASAAAAAGEAGSGPSSSGKDDIDMVADRTAKIVRHAFNK